LGPFRYKNINVRYITIFGQQSDPSGSMELPDVTFYEWAYFQSVVCQDGVAYPSQANADSGEAWPNSDSSWCLTGDTLDQDSVFLTTIDLAYQGLLAQGIAGYMSEYPDVSANINSIPVPSALADWAPIFAVTGEAAIGGVVSLLVSYVFPAANYNTGLGREDVLIPNPADPTGPLIPFPGSPSIPLGVNPVFYSLDSATGFQSVTNCELADNASEREACYNQELFTCSRQGGYIDIVQTGAGDQYFDCAPRGANETCNSQNPVPISGTMWGCEPGLFIRRPAKDVITGYQSPTLLRLGAGCVGFIKRSLVDEILGGQVCDLFQEPFCNDGQPDLGNPATAGLPRDLLTALCSLGPDESCVDLSPEYNELLAEGFCAAFPTESPGLLINVTSPEAGIDRGATRYYSGDGANELTRYFTDFQGQSRNVVFDDLLDDTVPRDAWASLNSPEFTNWREETIEGQGWMDPNVVAGHDVSALPKRVSEGATFDFFVPAIQRGLRFQNTDGRKGKVKGLETLVFDILPDELLPFAMVEPATENYYRQQAFYSGGLRVCIEDGTGCQNEPAFDANGTEVPGIPVGFEEFVLPAGNLNISSVKQQAPIFASRPYWYNVENLDPESTIGAEVLVYDSECEDLSDCPLRPMSDIRHDADASAKYASELNVFGFMGFTIGANVRLQINAAVSTPLFQSQLCAPLEERVVEITPIPIPFLGTRYLRVEVFAGCLFGEFNEEGARDAIESYLTPGSTPFPGVSCLQPQPTLIQLNGCTETDGSSAGCTFECGVLSPDGAILGPYFPGLAKPLNGTQILPIAYYDQSAFLSDDQADLLRTARDLKKYSFRVGWSLFAILGAMGIGFFAYGVWRKKNPQEVRLWSGENISKSFQPAGSFAQSPGARVEVF
jgi:hypothetical protein